MNRRFRFSRVALAVTAALSVPAFAQDDLEETIVTATRTPVPVDAIGSPVIVITRNDIERSLASDVSELLQQHAGLEIARTGGPGQQTSLFTRGTDSNHTVVLLDGVRINPGTIGSAALQNISPESLERIEIVKGPRSALYGTDAIGGVVQLFTRGAANGEQKSGGSAGTSFGTDDTRQYYGDASIAAGDQLRFGVGGSYGESDGMPVFVADDSDRGWRNVTGRASVEFDATDALTLRARGWRAAGRTEYSSQTFATPPYADASQDYVNSVYSVEADFHAANGLNVRGTVAQARDDIDQLQANFAGFDFAHTRRTSYEAQVDLPEVGGHLVSFGVQRSDEDTIANSFGTAFDENTGVTQGFVQDQFTAGIFTARAALGGVDHETFGSELTYNAEIGAAFESGTRVTLAAGKAFRAPDSTDRFGFGGNPDLDPEVSRQVELTVRQKLGAHQHVWVSAFDNRIRDLINFVVTDFVTFDGQNENVDRARIKGGELGYEYANAGWRARAELTLQDPRDETTDERLLRRARESAFLAVDRDVGPIDLGIDVAHFGNRKDFGFPAVTLDSYTLVNATVRWRATSALTLQGRLENAFDEDYTQAAGYRTRGRAYTIGVRYSFE
ncbi:MAG TPA: TonB-dependent receptor [Steroidobacteraceae bacterium]|nr:TonB-dependent receptor [Steroidobacteraceae bacterium]